MGNIFYESGHSETAAKYFQRAIQNDPKELQALIGLGNANYDLKNPKVAINYYK